jgi:hypothetical protein
MSFTFDPTKTHSDNLAAFLASLETHHADFSLLLRQYLSILTDGVDDDVSRRRARDKFNLLIKQRLGEFVDRNEEDGD